MLFQCLHWPTSSRVSKRVKIKHYSTILGSLCFRPLLFFLHQFLNTILSVKVKTRSRPSAYQHIQGWNSRARCLRRTTKERLGLSTWKYLENSVCRFLEWIAFITIDLRHESTGLLLIKNNQGWAETPSFKSATLKLRASVAICFPSWYLWQLWDLIRVLSFLGVTFTPWVWWWRHT